MSCWIIFLSLPPSLKSPHLFPDCFLPWSCGRDHVCAGPGLSGSIDNRPSTNTVNAPKGLNRQVQGQEVEAGAVGGTALHPHPCPSPRGRPAPVGWGQACRPDALTAQNSPDRGRATASATSPPGTVTVAHIIFRNPRDYSNFFYNEEN